MTRKRQHDHVIKSGALLFLYWLPITGKVLGRYSLYGVPLLRPIRYFTLPTS